MGGPSKRPRVFFTEDQKETLRLAYQQDPYPNQQTIECLANQLGVSPKTIINWFHNHRMRAKQQIPSSGSGTPVKSEDDAMSNHSDSMSVSSDNSYRQGPLSTSGGEASASQWMFPSFEPIRRSSTNSERSDPLANSDHFDSERFKSTLEGEPNSSSEKDLSLLIENNNLPPKKAPAAAAVTKSKRKSAKPQWSYEGTQLDKSRKSEEGDDNFTKSSSDDVQESVSGGKSQTEVNPVEDDVKSRGGIRSPVTTTASISDENENVTMETDDSQQQDVTEDGQRNLRGRLRNKKHLNCAIEKLQQAVNSKEVDWDDPVSSPPS